MRSSQWVVCALVVGFAIPGCGGGGPRVPPANPALRPVRSVAIVGLCRGTHIGARRGTAMVRVATSNSSHLHGFEEGVASALEGRTVLRFAEARQRAQLPTGRPARGTTCLGAVSPFAGRRPDVEQMAQMADALDVDAVLAVVLHPGVAFKGRRVQVFSGRANSSYAYVVGRDRRVLLEARIQTRIVAPAGDEPSAFRLFGEEVARMVGGYFGRI